MATQRTDYLEIQQNEIDALHSIFMKDFVEEEVKAGAWNKTTDRGFRLKLKAPSDVVGDVSVELAVSLPTTYPKSLPRCYVKYDDGVRQKTKAEIERVIKSKPKALLGSEMIFEIATSIQDILEDSIQANIQNVPALNEERAIQEAEAQQRAEQAQETQRRQQVEAALEEERLLARMVEQEQSRLAKLKAQPSRVPDSFELFEPTDDATDTLSFDRQVTTKDPKGFSVSFRVVSDKVEYRRGSITDVFTVRPRGSQKSLTPYLALKQCTLSGFKQEDKFKRAIQGLESDLEALMQLAPHPSILKPLNFRIQRLPTQSDLEIGGWSISILTELVSNGSIADLLGTVGTLQVASVRSWIIQIIEGLDFYHRHKIVHGALTPQNILLERTDTGPAVVKLCDGLFQHDLRLLKREADSDYLVAASAYWTAPEVSKDAQSKPSSPIDIWDLGVVFLQMLFGLEIQRLHASPTSLMEELDLSYSLADILSQIFRADSRKRPTAFDLLPHEFLRNDDPVLNQQTPLSLSNINSSVSLTGARAVRTRHDSTNIAVSSSRYSNDFVEAGRLGKGGFGEVVRARNKLDSRIYAIKKITQTSASALSGVLSEIILLSQLNHPNVVRYYTAWIEDEGRPLDEERRYLDSEATEASERSSISPIDGSSLDFDHSAPGLDFISSSGYPKIEFGYDSGEEEQESDAVDDEYGESDEDKNGLGIGSSDATSTPSRRRSSSHVPSKTTLYIQMEYCERQTLRDLIKGNLHENPEECWRLFRQTLEGLAHVHSNGIIHRDLKPDNLFIDNSNNIKIGDFGLARPGDYQATTKARSINTTNPSLTRSVGTSLYVAPEVKSTGAGNYNEKADMFSLGIIFFEMNYPLKTAMERVQMLEQLRGEKHTLPSDFEKPEMSTQGDIIESLLRHKPSERPSSIELLRSGKVPFELEDETIRIALQGIADKTSPYYAKLVSGLFSQTRHDANVKDHTYDTLLAANSENHEGLLRCLVRDSITAVFRRHGAVEQPRPLLLPNSAHYSSTAVRLLNSSGTLVQLPYDLTLPNARMLAKQQNCGRKTYAFADVYRENPTGGHPKRHGEVDFDIVSYDNLDLALREAEVLKVIDEILDVTPSLASVQMCYHINHSIILDNILEFCDIVASKRPAVKEIISKLNIGQWTWPKIRNELRAPSIAIPSTSLDELMLFDFRDTYDRAITKLRSLLHNTEELESTFSHLQAVTTYLLRFSVKRKVYISPLSSFNDKFYRGSILFQCVYDSKKRDVFAAGGRYDRLIMEHRSNSKNEGRHAVGFNLGWERLLTSMVRYQKNSSKHFLKEPEEGSLSQWAPRRCDVLVDSLDSATLRSTGLVLVQELWANNISAELVIDASSEVSGRQQSEEGTAPHSWVVIVKQDDILKVRSSRKEEHEIRASELVAWLRSEIRERDRLEGKTHDRTRLLRQTSSHPELAFNDREADVRVLESQTRRKKSNRRSIVEDASTHTQELVHSFLDSPIIAIETKDEVFEGLRDTRLSDPESWRRFIQSAPWAKRPYLGQVHELLSDAASEARGSTRNAFIYNFRTQACIYYDLGKPP